MRALLATVLVVASGCHLLFSYEPRAGQADGTRLDRAWLPDLERSPDVRTVDLAAKPDPGASDTIKTDRAKLDAAKDANVVQKDGKSKIDQTSADGGPCGSWSAWVCPSAAWNYCIAYCSTGTKTITCDTTGCKCAISGVPYPCSGALPGYCASCESALASGCCP
jgi:hypothetical protein